MNMQDKRVEIYLNTLVIKTHINGLKSPTKQKRFTD